MRKACLVARRLLIGALVVLLGVIGWAASGSDAWSAPRTLRLAAVSAGDVGAEREAMLPRELKPADVEHYKRIFALQKKGKWRAADREIKKLSNRLLMGHVLGQRYLHPTAYRSRFRELRDWLKKYADHPEAARIYKLAMRRKAKSARAPRAPVAPTRGLVRAWSAERGDARGYVSPRKRSAASRRKLINLIAHIRRHLRKNELRGALKHLKRKDFLKLADTVEYDIVRTEIAQAYFFAGKPAVALDLARASAARSGDAAPLSAWVAGLAAYRLGKLDQARRSFEVLAHSDSADPERVAAGAYWAARLNLITRRPEAVNRLLDIAASYPRSFYGLLALRALGEEPDFNWRLPPLSNDALAIIEKLPAARRAIALVEVGQRRRAETELRRIDPGADDELGRAVLALAGRLRLPEAQLRLGRRLARIDGRRHEGAIFPLPAWKPKEGFRVDRAVLYALIRQESEFNARAKSRVGARGLMQLMPRTASFIARDRRYRTSRRNRLFDPTINMTLGQKYVLHLFAQPEVRSNLAFALAAYNGGPGNLRKWRRRMKVTDDPLLFIESVPSAETRDFVHAVLKNVWIYRARLGQPAGSLDSLAGGGWPTYTAQDATAVAYMLNVGN